MGDYHLDWRGDEAKRMVMQNVANAWGEFGLEVEGESKRELRREHGVETGTLRRSIHVAEAGYDWSGDDVEPSKSSPERGESLVTPDADGAAFFERLFSVQNCMIAVASCRETEKRRL